MAPNDPVDQGKPFLDSLLVTRLSRVINRLRIHAVRKVLLGNDSLRGVVRIPVALPVTELSGTSIAG